MGTHLAEGGSVPGAHARHGVVEQVLDALEEGYRLLGQLGRALEVGRVARVLAEECKVDDQGEELGHAQVRQLERVELLALRAHDQARSGVRRGEAVRRGGGTGLGREGGAGKRWKRGREEEG